MRWLEVRLDTNHAGLEEAEAFLSANGIDDVVIDDAEEFAQFLAENRPFWGEADESVLARQAAAPTRLTFYLQPDPAGFDRLAKLRVALSGFRREHPEAGTLLLTLEDRESADWENNWKQYYQPIPIGPRLRIVPAWERSADGAEACGTDLFLDPGLAFGTGSHPTTRMCLELLEREVRAGDTVLDLGCGSGILFMAALHLGAGQAFACDIDPACRTVAAENAALNAIDPARYTLRTGDILTDAALRREIGGGYRLVLANIVSDVILGLADAVPPLLRPDGQFLCSGVIDTRETEVAQGLRRAGLEIRETLRRDGWCAFLCSRADT